MLKIKLKEVEGAKTEVHNKLENRRANTLTVKI